MLSAAHLVAQIGRRRVDRRETIDRAQRRAKPGQAVIGEAALEHLRGSHGAHLAGRGAQHHGDQPPAVARGRGNQIVTGRADESGLEAVGAGETADQLVEILDDPASKPDRGNVHEIFVFRQITNDGARKDREIAGRCDLSIRRQAVRIDVACLSHAEALRGRVHFGGKAIDRTSDAFGKHHGHVIGRFHQHHLQRVVDGDLGAWSKAHLGRRLRGCDR